MPFIHPHLALMPDAHLGKGATVAVGHPDPRRDHPGRGRRRHRLRHDRGRDPAHAPTSCRPTGGRCARRSSAAVPLSAGQYNTEMHPEHARRARSPSCERLRGPASTRPSHRRELAAAARHAGLGQPLHRGEPRRERRRVAVPALGLPGRRQQDRAARTSRSPSSCARSGGSTCPTATWPTSSRAPTEFWAYIRELRWAQRFALLNREEMMDRGRRLLRRLGRRRRGGAARRSTATTTTPSRRRHFGKDVWLSRKGAIDAGEGVRGLIPGSMGTRVVRRGRQGQPAGAELVPARRRPEPLARRPRADVHPRATSTGDGRASSAATPTRSSTRSRRRTRTSTW